MPVPPNPDVTIFFTGLLVLCLDTNHNFQVGVHSTAEDHDLKLTIIKRLPAPLIASTFTTHLSNGFLRSLGNLSLSVENPVPPSTDPRFFSRDDAQDFGLVLDLENKAYHHALTRKPGRVLKPILHVAGALFYTASATPDAYQLDSTIGPPTTIPVGPVAEAAAANFYLSDGQFVALRLGEGGPELLRLTKGDRTVYEITIDNSDAAGQASLPPARRSPHFPHYYEIFDLVPPDVQFDLDKVLLASPNPREIATPLSPPCNPIGLGISRTIDS
jgi:hypothetical protein